MTDLAEKLVLRSVENDARDRCVDLFRREDGTYGFEEFRLDPEDMGRWTMVGRHSHASFESIDSAAAAAFHAVPWLAE